MTEVGLRGWDVFKCFTAFCLGDDGHCVEDVDEHDGLEDLDLEGYV